MAANYGVGFLGFPDASDDMMGSGANPMSNAGTQFTDDFKREAKIADKSRRLAKRATLATCLFTAACVTGSGRSSVAATALPEAAGGIAIFRVHVDIASAHLVGKSGRRVYRQETPVLGIAVVEIIEGRATRTRAAHIADYQADVADGLAIVSLPANPAGRLYVAADVEVSDDPVDGTAALDCIGGPAPTFRVEPGQVLYVGDYDVSAVSVQGTHFSWASRFKQDADDARAKIAPGHPELAARLRPAQLQWMPAGFGADCVGH